MKNKKISQQIIKDLKSGIDNWRINEIGNDSISLEYIGERTWYSLVRETRGHVKFRLYYPSCFEFDISDVKEIGPIFKELLSKLSEKANREEEKEYNDWFRKAFPNCF
jgi:hypothetical protein